jgi:putative DNA primase/helicase
MLRINAEFIARSLKGKRSGAGFVAHCPSHDDRNPSLSITEAKDGRVLFKCHAGCTQDDVLEALRELGLRPTPEEREATQKNITYSYVDEDGKPLHRTIRTPDKRFWQEHFKSGAWVRGCGPRVVLYHLDELTRRRDESVCICEGEKDVDRLRSLGYLATCNPMGVGKWRPCYAATLRDRDIILFYDNDESAKKHVGQMHAAEVALSLCAVGCKLRMIDLPWGKDVSEFLDTGGTKEALERLIAEAPYVGVNEIRQWRARFDTGGQISGSGDNGDAGWPEPILLSEDPVEPLRPDILPGVLGDYSRGLARFTETPCELPVLAVLGVLSTAAAGEVEIEAEPGYIEPVNLYVCPVLESGNRKTAVVQHATKVLGDYETGERERLRPEIARLESERKTKEVVIDKLRKKLRDADAAAEIRHIAELEADLPVVPRPPMLFTADVTAERLEVLLEANSGRLAVISDEGGIFDVIAGRYNTTPNLDVWLKGHCQGHVRVHRMERATLVDKPHLTVLISPQPAVLSGLRDKEFIRGRGLLARFLFALPESPVGNRQLVPCHMPARVVTEYHELITRVLDWRPEEPRILRLSPEAYAAWKDFQRSIECQMADGERLCRLRDWASKLPGAALRIAGLLHVARLAKFLSALSLELEELEMQIAIEICTILTSHAIAVFGIVSEDPMLTKSKRLMRWISDQHQPEISKRDCFRAHRPHLFARGDEMDACFRILAEHHLIRVVERKTGGRPSEVIEVNPALKEGR